MLRKTIVTIICFRFAKCFLYWNYLLKTWLVISLLSEKLSGLNPPDGAVRSGIFKFNFGYWVVFQFYIILFSENQKVKNPLFDLQAKLLLWFSLTNSVFDYVNISLRSYYFYEVTDSNISLSKTGPKKNCIIIFFSLDSQETGKSYKSEHNLKTAWNTTNC